MVELLVDRYPNVCFWGCRGLQKKTRKLSDGSYFDSEDVYSRWGRLNHLFNLLFPKHKDIIYCWIFQRIESKCICAVSIGGSVYRQIEGQSIDQRMLLEEGKKVKKAPYYVIGANFGPYFSQNFYNEFHRYFSTCSGVSFRDKKSYNLFNDIPSVQYAPDVVFNVPTGNIEDDNKHVLISVIDLSTRKHLKQYTEVYQKTMVSVCKFFIQAGKTPVLISFCEAEGDGKCVNEIYSLLNQADKTKVVRYYYQGDTEELLEQFRKAHFVVATRFHAMILAMRFKKQLYTISYELKMDNILEETNSIAHCQIADVGNISPEQIFALGAHIVNVDFYIENAARQFSQLDGFLMDEDMKWVK